jgi:hypothetical protein
MADLLKGVLRGLAAAGKAAADLLAAGLIGIGVVLVIGGCVYRVFIRPEWTFDEAFLTLWPFFTAGIVSLALGWIVDRAETSSPGRP